MKNPTYFFLEICGRVFAFILFIGISPVFASGLIEDKPVREKTIAKTEIAKENHDNEIIAAPRNTLVDCPKACLPVMITKSKTVVKSTEMFSTFLADSTMNVTVAADNSIIIYEYGLRFTVTKTGKMVKVGSKLPKAGTYRVSIWDVATKTVIAQQYVKQLTDNLQSWADIPALALTANKEYFISIISNNWNDASPKSSSTISYPITKGNLKILAFAYVSQPMVTSAPKYPDMEDNTHSISGFVDFGFVTN